MSKRIYAVEQIAIIPRLRERTERQMREFEHGHYCPTRYGANCEPGTCERGHWWRVLENRLWALWLIEQEANR